MTSVLRKHGKWILAIVGSFLMLVFTLPMGMGGGGSPGDVVRGTLAGTKIKGRDLFAASRDLSVYQNFGLRHTPLDERDPDTHQFLLLQQAKQFGIFVTDAEVTDNISALKLDAAATKAQLDHLGMTYQDFRDSVADDLIIFKLESFLQNTIPVSLPRLENLANSYASNIKVSVATLSANSIWEKAPQPTPEQIQHQFDLYKTVEPAPSASGIENDTTPTTIDGHTYPFGYKYPDRVKVEYLEFDKAAIAKLFHATREDYQEAFKYYRAHPDEFPATPATAPATAPSSQPATQATTAPATQTAGETATRPATEASTAPAVKPFADVEDELVHKQIDERVDLLMRRMTDRATTAADDAWKDVSVSTTGFHVELPPAKWPSFQAIAADIKSRRDFLDYKPTYSAVTDWSSSAQLATVPGIGLASYATSQQQYDFPELAVSIKELRGEKPLGRLFLQLGEPGPVLQDAAGNLYVYRVTAADASHEPASLDEVRQQVITDLKKKATYEKMQVQARDLAAKIATAAQPGDELHKLAAADKIPVTDPPPFNRVNSTRVEIASIPGFVDAAFRLINQQAAATQPASAPSTAASQPGAAGVPGATALARDATLTNYIIARDAYTPLSPVDFSTVRAPFYRQESQAISGQFISQYLSLDSLAARLKYVPVTPFKSEE